MRAAGAALAAAAALFGVAACGDDQESGAASAPAPTPVAAKDAPGVLPETGAVPAGRHRTDEFEPTLEFTLGDGWSIGGPQLPDIADLVRADTEGLLAFLSPLEVIDPADDEGLARRPAPKDLVSFLRRHPRLTTGPARTVKVAGTTAVGFDLAVRPGRASGIEGCPDDQCVGLFGLSDGESFGLFAGGRDRVVVLDLKGRDLVISYGVPGDGFDRFSQDVKGVLRTLSITEAMAKPAYAGKPVL